VSTENIDAIHLAKLRDHYARHGAIPSYAGIAQVVGQTKTGAVKLARRLMSAGYLRTAPGGKLAPARGFFQVPLVDTPVRAGVAEAVEAQYNAELVTLDRFLVDEPSKTVLVRVKGDSMRDAGVFDGDLAVVERSERAESGQFVVAIVDDEFTLKELRYEGRQPLLYPHNTAFAVIRPANTLQIFGIVRGIVRRYRTGGAARRRQISGARP